MTHLHAKVTRRKNDHSQRRRSQAVHIIDESFLDLSDVEIKKRVELGHDLRSTVLTWTGIPTCVGIGPTKALAKLANHLAKKNTDLRDVCDLTDEAERDRWLSRTSLDEIWGVGPASRARLRAIHVQANDILDLLDESRVVRALEGSHAVRLEMVGVPDPLDGSKRDPDPLRHGASRPVRHLARWFGAGQSQHLGDDMCRMRRRAGRTRLVVKQALDPFFTEALLPAPNGKAADTRLSGNLQHGSALGREQHDARTLHVLERAGAVSNNLDQSGAISLVEQNANSLSHSPDSRASFSL